MGRRVTATTKGGKFMNPTDQARKEARRRELRKNKKQRLAVRQAVIKTKDPRQMLAELDTLDEMELNPSENLPYNDKVVKEKRIKLLENIGRITQYYIKEDPDQGYELKRLLDNYRKDRLKKEVYYESVRNAQKVKIDTIPLPDAPFQTPQLNEIPLPGIQPLGILKKPVPLVPLVSSQLDKRLPPGPPPGPPPAKKKYKGHDPVFHHPRPPHGMPPVSRISEKEDEREAYDPEDDPTPLEEVESDGDKSDDEFFHRDDDHDVDGERKRQLFGGEDDIDDEEHYERIKRAKMNAAMHGETSGITPLQAMMLKLAGQDLPTQKIEEPSREEGLQKEDGEKRQRKVGFVDSQTKPPPGPPPGLPPGPASLPHEINARHLQPGIIPPGPPPGHPPTLPPGPPPGLPPTLPMHMNSLPPSVRQHQGRIPGVSDPTSATVHGQTASNILSAPPSLINRHQEKDKEGLPTMIVAKPKIINNPKADVTRFMPTSLRVKRQNQAGKSNSSRKRDANTVTKSDAHKPVKNKKGKVNADAAYDSFMREMQGFL